MRMSNKCILNHRTETYTCIALIPPVARLTARKSYGDLKDRGGDCRSLLFDAAFLIELSRFLSEALCRRGGGVTTELLCVCSDRLL